MSADLPGPILNQASIFAQRLLLSIAHAPLGSAEADRAFTKWTLSFQLVFRRTLKGEHGWRTSAGRLAAMFRRLEKAKNDDYAGLWEDMLHAYHARAELEDARDEARRARLADTEVQRRLRRALRLSMQARFGKAAKALASQPALDPTASGVFQKMQALHPVPDDPISVIPDSSLPPKPKISPAAVKAALRSMDNDSAAGPDRMGVRWLDLIASSHISVDPDRSALDLLTTVIGKLTDRQPPHRCNIDRH